jgi:hypothetical protein
MLQVVLQRNHDFRFWLASFSLFWLASFSLFSLASFCFSLFSLASFS